MTDIDVLFAGVPVRGFEAARAWYSQLFGRAEDVVVTDDEVMWRFADAAWLYIIRDEQRAGRALVTLCVSDLDQTLADISDRGITSGPVEVIGDAGRKAVITDSEGNSPVSSRPALRRTDSAHPLGPAAAGDQLPQFALARRCFEPLFAAAQQSF